MSRTHEAFVLPLLFLTVALLGGVRVADRVLLLPPPLFALVLALLLVGVLVRSGALAPERIVHRGRSAMANLNGAIVIATLFAASTQAFNAAIPESGLPRLLFSVFLLVLLMNTYAASPDRVRVLRSMLVIFGSAFTLKFVVLAALSDPEGGGVKRVLQILLEGLTLGTLTQAPFRSVTGYIAFLTLSLFVAGLALLPRRVPDSRSTFRVDSGTPAARTPSFPAERLPDD
jgi:hypothetical protein